MTGIGGPTQSDRSGLEDRLRDAFSEARRVELSAGFFDGWPEALPLRPRISRRAPVGAAAAVAVAACLVVAAVLALHPSTVPLGASPSPSEVSSSSPGASGSTAYTSPSLPAGVIAWIDATPTPSPPATPSSTSSAKLPTCSAAALEMRFGGWAGLTGGTLDGGVSIAQPDPGAARCVIFGVPSVSLLDANGKNMSIDIRPIPSPDASPVVIEPGLPLPPEHTALLVGQAWFDFTWANWCGSNPGTVGTLVVHIPGAGVQRLSIPLDPPPCVTRGARSEMGVDPLTPADAHEPPPPAWIDLTADVVAPSVAVAGQPYRYLVTLRNTTDHPIPLDPCLTYVERLWSGSTKVAAPTYVLNCGPVGAIGSGGSATFEMVLEVPVAAPPGPAVMLWGTDGPGPSGPKLPITIAPGGSAVGSVAPATIPPSRDQLDVMEAKRVATAFETGRAGGDWQAAWQLLSPFSQAKIGSIDAFIHAETAFNLQGGSTFIVAEPSKDRDLLAPGFLGNDLFGNLKGNVQIERAWFVGVTHPDVSGASAGSEDLIVAPLLDGTWRVWVR